MKRNQEGGDLYESILDRFTLFIKANIQRFDPQKRGVDPDDIAQEVKLKLWRVIKDEKKIENYSSYIKKIVDSTVIDHIRRLRRQENIINIEKQKRISNQKMRYGTEDNVSEDYKQIIGNAVNSLIESRRKVVKLFLLDMTLEEISIYFNWSKDKTRNLLYRGLSDLKKKLKEYNIDYED